MDQLPTVLDRYGLPTVLTILVLFWVAKRLLEPLVLQHTRYLETTAEALASLADAYHMLTNMYARQNAIIERLLLLVPPKDPFDPSIHTDRNPFHEPRS